VLLVRIGGLLAEASASSTFDRDRLDGSVDVSGVSRANGRTSMTVGVITSGVMSGRSAEKAAAVIRPAATLSRNWSNARCVSGAISTSASRLTDR
jgi:hypothetical protein